MVPRPRAGFVALLAVCVALPALAQPTEISLGVGIATSLKVPGVRTVSLVNPRVADVHVVHGELVVSGLSVGRTSLIVWKRNGQRVSYLVVVHTDELARALTDVTQLLKDVEGVSIREVGEHILLEGKVYSVADVQRVEQVGNLYPKLIQSSVVFDPH